MPSCALEPFGNQQRVGSSGPHVGGWLGVYAYAMSTNPGATVRVPLRPERDDARRSNDQVVDHTCAITHGDRMDELDRKHS